MAPNFVEANACNNDFSEMPHEKTVIPTNGENIEDFLVKLLRRVLSARVKLERLPDEVVNKYRAKSQDRESESSCTDKHSQGVAHLRKVICRKCKLDGKHFSSSNARLARCKNCKNRLVYVCLKCDEQFPSRSKVGYHLMKTCNYIGAYHCRLCDYKSVHQSGLVKHVRGVHSIELNDVQKYFEFKND